MCKPYSPIATKMDLARRACFNIAHLERGNGCLVIDAPNESNLPLKISDDRIFLFPQNAISLLDNYDNHYITAQTAFHHCTFCASPHVKTSPGLYVHVGLLFSQAADVFKQE